MQKHEKNEMLQQQTFKQLLAFTYLAHTDQSKYGSILNGLITQQSLRNNQYPMTISEANNVLSNHKFDIAKFANKTPNNNGNNQAKHEPEQDKINLSFAQLESKHVNLKVNNNFLAWLKAKYANNKIRQIKAAPRKKHNYLAMILNFTIPGVLKIDMMLYIKKMLEDFPEDLNGKQNAHGVIIFSRLTKHQQDCQKTK
jgi:hypothetical protein